jgi:6-phosphogluconolactonase
MKAVIHFHHAAASDWLARELARFVAQRLRSAVQLRGQALLVVSGGSTPVPFLTALSDEAIDWARVSITLADERWVPVDHPDSNEGLVRRMLYRGRAQAARLVSLHTDAVLPEQAEPVVEARLATLPWPADVTVLGMGGDGHTASLFPHHVDLPRALSDQSGRCLAVAPPEPPNVPVARMTLSRKALLDTRQLVVHITGASKMALLKQAMVPGSLADWPIRLALLETAVPCDVFAAD